MGQALFCPLTPRLVQPRPVLATLPSSFQVVVDDDLVDLDLAAYETDGEEQVDQAH